MTKEQINRKIALQQGWTMVEGGWWRYDGSYEPVEPNYCNDLNAMHEAEKVLTDAQWVVYISKLHDDVAIYPTRKAVTATSRHRAEAFLRTLGLWED